MLCLEFLKVMTDAASNIDEEEVISSIFDTLAQSGLHRIKAFVHPAMLSLAIPTHVVVEALEMLRVLR